jgi:hypothetical protein
VARLMNKRACFATLYLPYAEVVSEPRAQAARMSGFIGARLDVEAMAAIADGALYRNRRDRSNFLVP